MPLETSDRQYSWQRILRLHGFYPRSLERQQQHFRHCVAGQKPVVAKGPTLESWDLVFAYLS